MPISINGTGPVSGITSINTSVSDTELGYLDGVTSAIQTQINGAGGLVKITDSTFTSSAAVNVNDVFSSTYDNYRILVDITGFSTTLNYQFRMRVSGSDDTGSNYSRVQISGFSTTVSANTTTGTSFPMNSINTRASMIYDVFGPNKAAATVSILNARIFDGTNTYINVESLTHTLTTAYTGFSLSTSTGNITGQVRVYGYRN